MNKRPFFYFPTFGTTFQPPRRAARREFFLLIPLFFAVCAAGQETVLPVSQPPTDDPAYREFSDTFRQIIGDERLFGPTDSYDAERTRAAAEIDRRLNLLLPALAEAAQNRNRFGHKPLRSFDFLKDSEGRSVFFERPETEPLFDFSPAPTVTTGRLLDARIEGDGFFQVGREDSDALFYTRAGRFEADADGSLFLTIFDVDGRPVRYFFRPVRDTLEGAELFVFNDPRRLASGDGVIFSPTERSSSARSVSPSGDSDGSSKPRVVIGQLELDGDSLPELLDEVLRLKAVREAISEPCREN